MNRLLPPPLFLLLSFFIITLINACTSRANQNEPESPAAIAAAPGIPADVHIVSPGAINQLIEIAGTLAANQEVSVSSELTKKVVNVPVKEGHTVPKGALLFQLDDADLQAQLERLHQQEKLAALNEGRLKDLIAHDAASQQDYDQAATNLAVIKAEIRQQETTIDKTRIRAPFAGKIGIIRTYPGALVAPNVPLTTIVDDAQIKVEFAVPEKYANLVNPGSRQVFTVEGDSTQFNATVTSKESFVDHTTRTLLVRAITPNPGGKLVAGQSAHLSIALHTTNDALQIPSQSLMPSSQGYSVFLLKNGKAQLTPVTVGQRDAVLVQITSGMQAGDTVIVSNQLRLSPGSAIRIINLK
ncbi:efflux transporter periplasmic adaptor subunit [Niastella yeongjuensis]|uniref:Efflux transporter periplasmic adaptor subunit n=1 Tax=Niastella yeongjuensis TaxID=354355 RepID=A0A1V9F576_9BACT|nr:efflux RND transporter periplasmic adaptor subunit [Niastella yeongjuensis]OQP53435.1 efflux transporter periplasmic adaptor subunit [Niastella yeongjuensis]SEP12351.1 membrane fusion protein, multidrug efflux system [Niastella yeongjuensis]